ncbi:gcn5-related n-acetyltransferase [Scheffersomyces coipomensis]|uniref:gcn5-related n-acetyltransferase n=1 Tax=Scheffersomyces coipomensis TaxID=1788519 RepID=UPI00315C67EA
MTASKVDPEEYELLHLTDYELIKFTRQQNSAAWKGRLTADDYIIRDLVLGKSKMIATKPNGLFVFMLRRISDKKPVSSIELLIRTGWRFDFENGEVVEKEVSTGCIGGVFTYPEYRGQGLARIMVDKMMKIAKSEIIGEDGFTFLYSEVGEYYVKNGFKSFEIPLVSIPLVDAKPVEGIDEKFELIPYHKFKPYLSIHNKQLKAEIIEKVKQDHLSRVTLVPTSDLVDWFHLRSKYISYKLFHEKKHTEPIDFVNDTYEQIAEKFERSEPHKFGLKLLNNDNDLVGYIIWTYDWINDTENYATVLKIVVVDGNDKETASLKLLSLLKNHLLKNEDNVGQTTVKISVWESEVSEKNKKILVSKWKSKAGLENSSRSAILINNKVDDDKLQSGDLIWEGNDKLSWF